VEPTVLVRAENGKVVIGGANEYGVQWLREHVSINVADALEKVLGKKVAVEFVVQPPVRENAD
jgi:chromosomal replication initiation ATPase DnaA